MKPMSLTPEPELVEAYIASLGYRGCKVHHTGPFASYIIQFADRWLEIDDEAMTTEASSWHSLVELELRNLFLNRPTSRRSHLGTPPPRTPIFNQWGEVTP